MIDQSTEWLIRSITRLCILAGFAMSVGSYFDNPSLGWMTFFGILTLRKLIGR